MNSDTIKQMLRRHTCPECGALRINTSSQHSSCPAGHGRLHPHIVRWNALARAAWIMPLPIATKQKERRGGRKTYTIGSRGGSVSMFVAASELRQRMGTERATIRPGVNLGRDEVIARIPVATRWKPRVFRRVP